MSAPRHAPARDHGERSIVDALFARGWNVYRKLPVDLLAICRDCGRPMLIEVKNADGRDKLTPIQKRLIDAGGRVEIVYDPGEIPRLVAAHRREFHG